MKKSEAIDQAYRIGTLTEPTEEIQAILHAQDFERALELLLVLRLAGNVRNVAGFLRRAVEEGWKPGTTPQKVNRKFENAERRIYERQGMTSEEAQARVVSHRGRGLFD